MAIIENSNQYKYTGRGPLDAKSIVKTYGDLLNEETWKSSSGANFAYNGMLVVVWANKEDISLNGVYILHDPAITTTFKSPDVTDETNWHQLCLLSDLADLRDTLSSVMDEISDLTDRVSALEENSDVLTFAYRNLFPTIGKSDTLYVAMDTECSYIWNDAIDDYFPVSGDSLSSVGKIHGGNA